MLKQGDRVMVKNTVAGGKQIDEGAAVLKSLVSTDRGEWMVEFTNETGQQFRRFVQEENKVD